MLNEWRQQPETWMRPDTFKLLATLTNQQAHEKKKSAFDTILFELFGDKTLVETLRRFPVCSAQQPDDILNAKWPRCGRPGKTPWITQAKSGEETQPANQCLRGTCQKCSRPCNMGRRQLGRVALSGPVQKRLVGRASERSH